MTPLRHRLFLMGLLLGRNYRHDTEKSCQTQPHAVDLTRSQAITCSAYYYSPATKEEHKTCQACGLPVSTEQSCREGVAESLKTSQEVLGSVSLALSKREQVISE
jgi:hypothetical protein